MYQEYAWPGSNWRPSACEVDLIATRPQVRSMCNLTSASYHKLPKDFPGALILGDSCISKAVLSCQGPSPEENAIREVALKCPLSLSGNRKKFNFCFCCRAVEHDHPCVRTTAGRNECSSSISGLVVENIVAIDVTRIRFQADAFLTGQYRLHGKRVWAVTTKAQFLVGWTCKERFRLPP